MQNKYKEETAKPCPNTILSRKGNDYFLSRFARTIVSYSLNPLNTLESILPFSF